MKILSIRIKNLASLEGFTEIDFTQEPLCSAGIFAITGPTGAGKSTILDALCLALYAKTPRYLQAKESGIELTDRPGSTITQGDVRGILRDGTGDGFAEVDFVAVDNQNYRATWRVRRSRDKAEGSLQNFTMALKNISANADVPGKKTELLPQIERLVGLNFEQFTRSVLLAQGDFTAFLKAAKDEKSALLEKLTGTHIYSQISQRVFSKYKEQERELEILNLQREGIHTLTTEELNALLEQQELLSTIISSHQKEVAMLNAEIDWHVRLSEFRDKLNEAQILHNSAVETKQQAANRERELKLVEKLQPTRSLLDSRRAAEAEFIQKGELLVEQVAKLNELQEQKAAQDILLNKANESLAEKNISQENAKPLLIEARGLDVQISEKARQVEQVINDLQSTNEKQQEQSVQVNEKQKQLETLEKSIAGLQLWREENIGRQPIADYETLIGSKLTDAGKLLDTLHALTPQINNAQENLNNEKINKSELDTQTGSITIALDTVKENYSNRFRELSAISITEIEHQKGQIDIAVTDIIAAEAHWKTLFYNQGELNNLKQKLTENQKKLSIVEPLLKATADNLTTSNIEREASLRMLDKARLAAAENVETLRLQLVVGEACPVCGSEDHPFVDGDNPKLDHVLNELETEYKLLDKRHQDLLTTEGKEREACKQLKNTIFAQEQELGVKENGLQILENEWRTFAIQPEATQVPDEQKASWLNKQLGEKKVSQKNLLEQIQLHAKIKKETEKLREEIIEAERQLTGNINSVKDADRSIASLQEQIHQRSKEQLKCNDGLSELEQDLSGYFTTADWFANWKNEPALFLERINNFAAQWKAKTEQLVQEVQDQKILAETITGMERELKTVVAEVEAKEKLFSGLREQMDVFLKSRNNIYDGEAATAVETRLRDAVRDAQQAYNNALLDMQKMNENILRAHTQIEELQKNIVGWEKKVKELTVEIQQWIISFNTTNGSAIDIVKFEALLAKPVSWIDAERAAFKAMDDTVVQADSVLNERTTLLQQHEEKRKSERDLEALQQLLNEANELLQDKTKSRNEIGFQLQQDASNKIKIGDLLDTIAAKALLVEDWAKLNDIIGSADGKKFRQIAQEYTLDVLLGYANIHLKMLSKRYRLQRIPNTLGLQVLDQDMGDEIRTVYSLSGGESFLVSLALALGLASLSSSRMKVESLFIDEGFGSLDPVTLNIAMDALECLHNQGRKVGVISHVQEMTERIPVQIKVSKENSGRSKVEVMGV